MDRGLGTIIDDYTLYRIIEAIIVILYMFMVYLGIQIALTWKFLKKDCRNSDEILSQKGSFIRCSIFISITGFFISFNSFFEGIGELDSTTYELIKLIAFSGLIFFFYEWYKLLSKVKKRT